MGSNLTLNLTLTLTLTLMVTLTPALASTHPRRVHADGLAALVPASEDMR